MDISNNRLLDDYSQIIEQVGIIERHFNINEIQQISIDIEPHAHFNRKDENGDMIYPDWPDNMDYYFRIYTGLVRAITEAFPERYFSIATPTFFPAWVYRELYELVDCIYIMYYVSFNDGKLEQIQDIYNVFKSKKAYVFYQLRDFNSYDELDVRRLDTQNRTEINNFGLLSLETRIDFLNE